MMIKIRENEGLAKKGNLMKETESLLLAAKSNAIRTNPIKARLDAIKQQI